MILYWIYKDGKRFCLVYEKEQAERIAKANNATIVVIEKK